MDYQPHRRSPYRGFMHMHLLFGITVSEIVSMTGRGYITEWLADCGTVSRLGASPVINPPGWFLGIIGNGR